MTLQPIERFDFDAAIIFSDILMVPWALDRNVHFIPGIGPKLTPLSSDTNLDHTLLDKVGARLAPVGRAIELTRSKLAADKAFSSLKGPIKQVCAPHSPTPFSPELEAAYLPDADKITAAIKETLA